MWGEESNTSDFTEVFGTGTFTFQAFDVGAFTVTPNAKYMGMGYTNIGYDLRRDIVEYKIPCPSFDNKAN